MINDTKVGDQTPDLQDLIDDAAKEVSTEQPPEATEPATAEVEGQEVGDKEDEPKTKDRKVPDPPPPPSTIPVKGPGAMVRLLPSMKHRSLNPGQWNAGMETFDVPSREHQEAGFWMPNGKSFVAEFQQFGFMVKKDGSDKPSVEIK